MDIGLIKYQARQAAKEFNWFLIFVQLLIMSALVGFGNSLCVIVGFLLAPIYYGIYVNIQNLFRNEKVTFNNLFSGFDHKGRFLKLVLLEFINFIIALVSLMPLLITYIGIYIKLILLLENTPEYEFQYLDLSDFVNFEQLGFVIVITLIFYLLVIIYYLFFAQVKYIICDNPDLTLGECFSLSARMMKGNKLNYVGFVLSFIGHYLLVIISCGLWALYLIPYFEISAVNYYNHLKEQTAI